MVSGTVKLLLGFYQLSELVLLIDYNQDLSHIYECLSKLHNLRKLRIEVRELYYYRNLPNPNRINDLGKILGANLNLTHLELFWQDAPSGVSFSTIFGHIPASSPLKLEHLGICGISPSAEDTDLRAIIPHIRSLTSIHLAYPLYSSRLIRLLHSERIFPPIIRTTFNEPVSRDLIHYLNDHPEVISLSISRAWLPDPMTRNHILLEMLARHSKSLTYFSVEIQSFFYFCNWNVQGEFSLLQCTKLEQLVLSSFGSWDVTCYAVSEQYTKTYGGVEDTPID